MDYDRGGQAPTAIVASYRGSHASTATNNVQHICRRTQRRSSLQQPTRTPTTTEANKLAHTYESTKIAPQHLGAPRAAQSDVHATSNRLGPHPRDAARQACKADQPVVRLRQRQALQISSTREYDANWPRGVIHCQPGLRAPLATRWFATPCACTLLGGLRPSGRPSAPSRTVFLCP